MSLVLRRTRPQRPPLVPELVLQLGDDITSAWEDLEHEHGRELAPPFWAFAWVGGQVLARYVLDTPSSVAGLRVLDLATGSGLCALAARRAGAASVLAVDVDPLACAAVAVNAAANDLGVDVLCADASAVPLDADVVLAGDVCYDREMTDALLPALRRAAATGRRVLLGDPGRHYLPQTGLVVVAEHQVPVPVDLEGVAVRRARVYEVRP